MAPTGFSRPLRSSELDRARAEMERALWAEVNPLYMHGLDAAGFVPVLGPGWEPGFVGGRGLVQAARMTWTAAELVRRRGREGSRFAAHASHGVRTIRDRFWDPEYGGVFWRVRAEGGPDEESRGRKHLYGGAFAVYGLANAAEVLGDAGAGDLAFELFAWLERCGRDDEHGGYFECLTREGAVLARGDEDAERPGDDIPRPAWCKSMNAHLHMLEALTALYRVRPDGRVSARIRELMGLFFDRVVRAEGGAYQYFSRSWVPRDGETSYGHDVEIGYLMVEAAEVAWPERLDDAWRLARGLLEHALRWGFDHGGGGLYAEGPAGEPATDRTKVWWAQAEMINACSMMDARYGGDTGIYRDAMLRNWEFCRDHMIDWERGGWRWSADEVGRPMGPVDKANGWKTAYHTARAMMNTVDRLGREEA